MTGGVHVPFCMMMETSRSRIGLTLSTVTTIVFK